LHAERQRDAKEFLVGAFRLDHDSGDDRQAGFKRPSLPVKQTCLAFASCPFRQNLVQGE
jgi:hypothetical protein